MKSTGNRLLDVMRLRWRSLKNRGDVEQELDEELRFHFDSLVEGFEAKGFGRQEAKRMATIEMGNGVEAIRDECRDTRGWTTLEQLWRDVQYSLRGMARNPLFTLTAAGALALGIGVNSAAFTLVYSLMYRPMPVEHPETMRNVHMDTRGDGPRGNYGTRYYASWDEFQRIQAGAKSAELAGLAEVSMSRKDDPHPVDAHLVSANYLPLIGGHLALGRFIKAEEASSPGQSPVAVLSHRAWKIWFAGDPNIVGKQIVLNRTPFTVAGVADEKTTGVAMTVPDLWIPLSMQALTRPGDELINNPNLAWIRMVARRRAGFNDAAVQAELQVLAQNAVRSHAPKKTVTVTVEPAALFNYPYIKNKAGQLILIVWLAVGLVLTVACANVANMLLARGLARRREMAIRVSIGAGRARLIQQMLTESVMLALLGAAGGLVLATFGSGLTLLALPADMYARQQIDLSPDGRVLLFTGVVAVFTGLLFGLVPAWNALRFQPGSHLKAEGLVEAGGGRHRLQFGLIAVQVAVCLVLLVNAGLLLRGLQSALTGDPGQATSNIAIAHFDLRQQQYTAEAAKRFIDNVRERAGSMAGIRGATSATVLPLHQQCGTTVKVENRDVRTECNEVGPDFMKTAGVRLIAGREFQPFDTQDNAAPVVIVDEDFARTSLPGNPVGQSVQCGQKPCQVIGVVAHTRSLNVSDFGAVGKIYTPMRGAGNVDAMVLASYAGPYQDVEQGLRRIVSGLDPNVNVRVQRIEETMQDALAAAKLATTAAATLGGFALILAVTGIYGVVSFAVTRRRKEIGIRVALGASRALVLRLIVWQGMRPVATGAVAGLALAAAASQLLRAMLYGVSPFDPLSFAGTALLLVISAVAASLIPASSAMKLDPVSTLRQE